MDDPLLLPPDRDLPARRLQLRREHLVQEITTARRAVRPLAVALAGLALVLALSGFGAYALTREPTHVDSIGCYESADVRANVAVIGSDATDPVAACAELWRTGAFGTSRVVPQLTPCVLDTGAVAVVPGGPGICEGLGIASLSEDARARLVRLGQLRAALSTRFGDGSGSKPRTGCIATDAAARRAARAELDARGYGDWTVELVPPSDGVRRCATTSLEPSNGVVVVLWP